MAQVHATIDASIDSAAFGDPEPDRTMRHTGRALRWRRIVPGVVCLALYVVLTGLAFGRPGLISSQWMTGPRTADQIGQLWWVAWAHTSLAHGLNPLFTDWQNYPVGMNFGLNGSILGLTLPIAPITAAFGPIVSWDVLLRLAPIASAFSMCLVLRRWTQWWPAAFAGGLLYGFSAYVLLNADGYLFLAFVPMAPLMLFLVADIVERQRWNPVLSGVLLAVAGGFQYLISSEILASTALMGALGAVLYLVANRRQFAAKAHHIVVAVIATLVSSVVTLVYFVGFTFVGPQHAVGPPNSPSELQVLHGDLLGFVVPGPLYRLSVSSLNPLWANHLGNAAKMYLGVPLLVAIGVTVYLLRRRGIVVLLGILTGVSLILSLGSVLYVGGVDTHVPLPFAVLAHLPLLEGLQATRFSLFTALFGAAIIAIGVDELHARLPRTTWSAGLSAGARRTLAAVVPLALVVVVALPLLPAQAETSSPTAEAPVFTSKAIASIPYGSVLLGYPYPHSPYAPTGPGGTSVHTLAPTNEMLVDQSVSGMRFKLIGGFGWRPTRGYYGAADPSKLLPASVQTLFDVSFFGVASPGQAKILKSAHLTSDIRTFVHRYQVDTVVVLPIGAHPETVVAHLTAALGPPRIIDGSAVWLGLRSGHAS